MPKIITFFSTLLLSLMNSPLSFAKEEPAVPPSEVAIDSGYDIKAVPFIMSLEDWGFTVALAGVAKGVIQPPASVFGGGAISENGTYLGYAGLFNLMVPGWDQTLFDLTVMETDFKETRFFLSENSSSGGQNNSSHNDSIRSPAHEKYYQFFMKYTLPIGAGKDGALPAEIKRNMGYDAGQVWNPMVSGVTTIEVLPYYKTRKLDHYSGIEPDKSIGVRVELEYDNRNSKTRPTQGSNTAFRMTYDPGSSDRPDWATVEFEFSKFFNLGSNNVLDEQVIAMNGWLADTPTWNNTTDVKGTSTYRRPPSFAGVALGGFDRLRGYSSRRFHGRSAVSYSLEYRVTPRWQPLDTLPLIGPLYNIPWWQWTLFMDAGRVADNFDLKELHSDVKTNVGGGIRFMVEGITVRAEMVTSSEDTMLRVFINQPF